MFQEILEIVYFDNQVFDYTRALGLFIAGFIGLRIVEFVAIRRLKKFAEKTETTIDDFLIGIIQNTVLPFSYFGLFYFCVNTLQLGDTARRVVNIFGMAVLTLFVARLTTRLVGHGFNVYWTSRGKDVALERSLKGITMITKLVIWSLAIIFFLDNLGFKISAVIAGMGIGGVALALAAQAILGDLFSYFAIIFDRPFEVGDFIIIGDYLGSIENIGIKTTRIRSLGGEQLVFSNTDLTNSRVRNYKRMEKRRVVFKVGVTYQTSLEHVKAIPGIIRNAIQSVKDTVFDRAHFFSYGDFSLIFEVVYYVIGADYNKYMDIQQEINFAIKEEFEARKIDFAYPTQTLYVAKT